MHISVEIEIGYRELLTLVAILYYTLKNTIKPYIDHIHKINDGKNNIGGAGASFMVFSRRFLAHSN